MYWNYATYYQYKNVQHMFIRMATNPSFSTVPLSQISILSRPIPPPHTCKCACWCIFSQKVSLHKDKLEDMDVSLEKVAARSGPKLQT